VSWAGLNPIRNPIPYIFKKYLNCLKPTCTNTKKFCVLPALCICVLQYNIGLCLKRPLTWVITRYWPRSLRYHYNVNKSTFQRISIFIRRWEILRNCVDTLVRTTFLWNVLCAFPWGSSKTTGQERPCYLQNTEGKKIYRSDLHFWYINKITRTLYPPQLLITDIYFFCLFFVSQILKIFLWGVNKLMVLRRLVVNCETETIVTRSRHNGVLVENAGLLLA
jgi:hypothetical protein